MEQQVRQERDDASRTGCVTAESEAVHGGGSVPGELVRDEATADLRWSAQAECIRWRITLAEATWGFERAVGRHPRAPLLLRAGP